MVKKERKMGSIGKKQGDRIGLLSESIELPNETPKDVLTPMEEETLIIRRGKDGKMIVIAGTLQRLIELLTEEQSQGTSMILSLFVSKSFMRYFVAICRSSVCESIHANIQVIL